MVHIKKTQNLKKAKYREKKEGIILLDPHEAKWHFEIINNWILSPRVCPCLLSFTHEVSKLCASFHHKRGENPRVARLVFKKLIPFLNIFAAMVSKRFRSENLCPDNKQSNMSHTHTHTHATAWAGRGVLWFQGGTPRALFLGKSPKARETALGCTQDDHRNCIPGLVKKDWIPKVDAMELQVPLLA